MYPFLRSLLAIILGDADRLEALRVLVTAEPCEESWEMIAIVSTLCLTSSSTVRLESIMDHASRLSLMR
jgi:hypothetical protein